MESIGGLNPPFPLGMVNGDDYTGDLILVYEYSVGERLCLRITILREGALLEGFADVEK